jgi:hypothetical protein
MAKLDPEEYRDLIVDHAWQVAQLCLKDGKDIPAEADAFLVTLERMLSEALDIK